MVKLSKYDKDLKRDVVVETSVPAEANQLRNQGFKEVKPAEPQAVPKAAGKKSDKDNK